MANAMKHERRVQTVVSVGSRTSDRRPGRSAITCRRLAGRADPILKRRDVDVVLPGRLVEEFPRLRLRATIDVRLGFLGACPSSGGIFVTNLIRFEA
jgi:hypothetical protein